MLSFSASLKPSLQERPPVISIVGSEALEKYKSENVNLHEKRYAIFNFTPVGIELEMLQNACMSPALSQPSRGAVIFVLQRTK